MTVRPGSPAIVAALLIGLSAMAGPAMAPPAAAQQVSGADVDDLRYRLRRLERDFNALRGGGPDIPSSLATRFQDRLNQMERTIQNLTDKLEDLIHRVEKAEKKRDAFETDTDYRLGRLEQRAGVKADARTPKPAPRTDTAPGQDSAGKDSAGQGKGEEDRGERDRGEKEPAAASAPSILPPGKESEQYRFAFRELREALRQDSYDRAERAFGEFLSRHPNGRFAGNAHYWLGETYFAQRKYRQAAILFADGLKKFPKHAKAPDNLLKLGLSMAHLKKTEEACASWAALKRRYPSAPDYVKRRAAEARKKFGCRA